MTSAVKLTSQTRERLQNRRNRIIAIVVVIALLALIVPLCVIVPRSNLPQTLPSYMMLPLYSYPESGAWAPLQEAIATHPDVSFKIIVNPADGPGSGKYPDEGYITALQNLTVFQNVQLIGYVRTSWATRTLSSVVSDILVYSEWASYTRNRYNSSSIAVHGIFFDEVPHVYTTEAAEYLTIINQKAKNAAGILGTRTVIHNPGTIVDERLDDPNTDVTVVFEDSYHAYRKKRRDLIKLSDDRSRHSYMIHSVPAMSSRSFTQFVNSLTEHAQALFVTNLDDDFYKSFGSDWQDFVRILHQGQSVD